jgi:hypothetical protein
MEALICLVFWLVVIAGAMLRARLNPRIANESLCLACVNAVVTRGTYGKAMVACSFGGAMRPVKFTVCQCTGFCVKAGPAKLVTIEGFVRNEREVYTEVAIR